MFFFLLVRLPVGREQQRNTKKCKSRLWDRKNTTNICAASIGHGSSKAPRISEVDSPKLKAFLVFVDRERGRGVLLHFQDGKMVRFALDWLVGRVCRQCPILDGGAAALLACDYTPICGFTQKEHNRVREAKQRQLVVRFQPD